jgi:hypothetical protein
VRDRSIQEGELSWIAETTDSLAVQAKDPHPPSESDHNGTYGSFYGLHLGSSFDELLNGTPYHLGRNSNLAKHGVLDAYLVAVTKHDYLPFHETGVRALRRGPLR